jgi:anti-anti-sigma factor
MHITLARDHSDLIIHIDGVLSFHHYLEGDELIDGIRAAIAQQKPTIIRFDLSKTQSLDSHWLGTFIRIFRRAKEQQIDMIIEHASADVRRLFSLVQIDRIITITP